MVLDLNKRQKVLNMREELPAINPILCQQKIRIPDQLIEKY